MRIVRLLIKSSLPLFLIACFSSVLTGVSSTLVIRQIHIAISEDQFNQTGFITNFLLFWIGYGALALVSTYSVSLLTQTIIHKLRIQLSTKILNAQYIQIEHSQSKLLPILTEDIKTIAYSIDRLPSVTTGLATVIGIISYMIWTSPLLSAATILLFVLVFLIMRFTLPYVRKYAEKARDAWNDLFKQFEGLVFGIKELTLNQQFQSAYIKDLIDPTSRKQNQFSVKENLISSITSKSTDLILLLGIGGLIVLIFNTSYVNLDYFGEYLTLVLFTIAPLSTAAGFLSSIKRIEVALEQVERAGINLDHKEKGEKKLPQVSPSQSIIKLREIEHKYYHFEEETNFVLGPLDLEIGRSEIIFLVGGNGSGKTTLAKILTGLYHPEKGKIYYGETLISDECLKNYRDKFSAIFTDSYLFDHLIHLDKEMVASEAPKLIETLELSKKVAVKDGSFTTNKLSSGQTKRMALMVSILENKEFYLFDEWAANQDPHFKKVYYEQILPQLKAKGKTVIVITHDEHYFHCADSVIKLVDGQIS